LAALVTVVALGVAACGGGSTGTTTSSSGSTTPEQPDFTDNRSGLIEPAPAIDSANRVPRGASVSYNDPPPPIAAAVKAAAETAKCTVASFASEKDPQSHIEGESAETQSIPPLSGAHNGYWAAWGVYNKPIPYKFQLHNLEHGGVVIHYGTDVSVEGVNALRTLWAASPAYLIVVPDSNPKFPSDAVVVGSQQRWMVCKPFAPAQVSAIQAYVDEYRGRGPEQIAPKDVGGQRPPGLPAPKIPDKGAE
jgi:hypothetical protein